MPFDFINSTLHGAVVGVATDAINAIYADTASYVAAGDKAPFTGTITTGSFHLYVSGGLIYSSSLV